MVVDMNQKVNTLHYGYYTSSLKITEKGFLSYIKNHLMLELYELKYVELLINLLTYSTSM